MATTGTAQRDGPAFGRLPLLLPGIIALVTGLHGGLQRLGWEPPGTYDLSFVHGPLMVAGFFGTLISLERAVALQSLWAYAAPLAAGLGALALLAGLAPATGAALFVLGAIGLLAGLVVVTLRQPSLHAGTMAAGAGCWLIGALVWLGGAPVRDAVPWWMLFLALTIAGERLELSRLLRRPDWAPAAFAAIAVAAVGGALLFNVAGGIGLRLLGLAFLALALWLARFDLARHTVRQSGLTQFVAVCLLGGYVWLAVTGALLLLTPEPFAGLAYDASLHALFAGFVFAMVFGHAPIIFPAVLRVPVPHHAIAYLPLGLLHLSLLARVAGDLAAIDDLRSWGGFGNAVAVFLFLGLTIARIVWGLATSRRHAAASRALT